MRLDIVTWLGGPSLPASEREVGLALPVYPSRRLRKSRHRHRYQGGRHRTGRPNTPYVPPAPTEPVAVEASPPRPREPDAHSGLTADERALMAELVAFLQARRTADGLPDPTDELEVFGQVAAARMQEVGDQPVSVIVGPCASLADVEQLIDGIAVAQEIRVLFEAFQGGFYRFDGRTRAITDLARWLAERADVETVTRQAETLHVVPAVPGA